MKRDFDLIREILLYIEENAAPAADIGGIPIPFGKISDENLKKRLFYFPYEDRAAVRETLRLLKEAGYIEYKISFFVEDFKEECPLDMRLTWKGHDLLDSIRDEEVWRKSKEGARKAGEFSLDLLKELAKGYMKKKISEQTGVELDI